MSSVPKFDVAVVGGGIVGLSHAWAAAKRGLSVVLFERNALAQGASVRNFGMVWPIGQTAGRLYGIAIRSRALWRELVHRAGLWHTNSGSIHLATHEDELQVMSEFAQQAEGLGYQVEMLTTQEVCQRSPAANGRHVLGGLWSSTEMGVNPRQVIARMPQWLHETYGVTLCYGTLVNRVQTSQVFTAAGDYYLADRVLICSGADFQTLFPEVYRGSGIRHCKLQMMSTVPQGGDWRIGPLLASGLTLRHYPTFGICPSLERLKARVSAEMPEMDRYGIHALVSQNHAGEVILGDSHEYDQAIEPFDKQEINELILGYLRQMIQLRDWRIAQRWHGVYAKLQGQAEFTAEPETQVHVINGTGGAGMTMSFGLAELHWQQWEGPPREHVTADGVVETMLPR